MNRLLIFNALKVPAVGSPAVGSLGTESPGTEAFVRRAKILIF